MRTLFSEDYGQLDADLHLRECGGLDADLHLRECGGLDADLYLREGGESKLYWVAVKNKGF